MLAKMIYQALVGPWLFRGDPERVHERVLALAVGTGRSHIMRDALETLCEVQDCRLRQIVFGIEFPNRVGLAAGYDKNAVDLNFWPSLVFVEVGSATAHPQQGNPPPQRGPSRGAPLRARATECVRHIWRQTKGRLPVTGGGGIFTAAGACEKIRAGTRLVKVWTAMIYQGSDIAAKISNGLLQLLERDGFGSITEAVGTE
jgi:dihydroorotate dehydrogenase